MLDRREFSLGVAAALVAAKLPSTGVDDHAFVLDCNSGADLEKSLDVIRQSGITAFKLSLAGATGGFEAAVAEIGATMRDIERAPGFLLQVRSAADLDRAKRERKTGVIFSFESANMLGDSLDRIDTFRNLGVLVMQLTYNRTTPFGVGCLDGDTGGLTPLGREAVQRMNAGGVALDLSHSNTQTTAEGIAASSKPAIISHAGCRAINPHPRNKEDREMRALADRGGVMGIYMLPFLAPSPVQPTAEIYMKHMTHALDVCGEDHVGIGTDGPIERFDDSPAGLAAVMKDIENRKRAGVSAPGEDRPPYIPDLNGPRKLEKIANDLRKRGYPSRVAGKVIGGNFRRVFGEIWNPAAARS